MKKEDEVLFPLIFVREIVKMSSEDRAKNLALPRIATDFFLRFFVCLIFPFSLGRLPTFFA